VSYSDEFNARANLTHLQLSAAGLAEEAGLQSLNNVRVDDNPKYCKQKKEEKRYHEFLQLLTETQIKLQDFIDEIERDLLQARRELQEHKDMLAERIALEHCIDVLQNDGLLERNVDGSLKDKNLERTVTYYLKSNNMDVDLSDDARIYAVSQNLILAYPAQDKLNDVIDLDEQIISTIEDGKEQAVNLQGKLSDPEISSSEVNQISEDVDKLSMNVKTRATIFIHEKSEILNSVQFVSPQEHSTKSTISDRSIDEKTTEDLALPIQNISF